MSKIEKIIISLALTSFALLALAIVKDFIRARSTPSSNACINNLRQMDGAKQQWALELGKSNGVLCTESDIMPYFKLDANSNLPKCPQDGKYTVGKLGEPPTCSLGKTKPHHVLPP